MRYRTLKLTGWGLDLPDGRSVPVVDFTRLRMPHRYIALVPQWDLLDLLAEAGKAEPSFTLRMSHDVTGLLQESGPRGRRALRGARRAGELRADLTIACDGRWSLCRREGGLVPRDYPVHADVWWFRLPRAEGIGDTLLPRFKDGRFVGVIPRKGYLQTAYFLRKGADAQLRARGLEALRQDIVVAIPELSEAVYGLESMDDVKLLEIRINRLRRWYTDGLLCIGDAAHAMSPAGGVGINLAVQDAVAAAHAARGTVARPPRHRQGPGRRAATPHAPHGGHPDAATFLARGDGARDGAGRVPAPNKLLPVLAHFPQLSAVPAYLMGVGVRPEHAPQFARRAPRQVPTNP